MVTAKDLIMRATVERVAKELFERSGLGMEWEAQEPELQDRFRDQIKEAQTAHSAAPLFIKVCNDYAG
ncbi:hypothetical protein AX761_22640 [Rhizobium sp. 58]|nr:hypothetical protein AX761_22640 [Rhizobium sp. 58]